MHIVPFPNQLVRTWDESQQSPYVPLGLIFTFKIFFLLLFSAEFCSSFVKPSRPFSLGKTRLSLKVRDLAGNQS